MYNDGLGLLGQAEMKLFIVCQPGVEPFLSRELRSLGLSGFPPRANGFDSHEEKGGLELEGSFRDVYACNLHLRTASRVLVRLGSFHAATFDELRRKSRKLTWERYLKSERPITLRVTSRGSRLYHETAVAERIAGTISDRLGGPVQVAKFRHEAATEGTPLMPADLLPQLILVRLLGNECTISIDSSGELLYRRGYRLAATKAPLRETLAAGMLLSSGWDLASPLIDPFCGSGTIPIEAALLAQQIPPGKNRCFSFMHWPDFQKPVWDGLFSTGSEAKRSCPKILASDRDAGAVSAAKENAARAGVSEWIEFSCRAVSSIDPPAGPGWVVTNPPYGIRTESDTDLRNLYAQFGKVLRAKCPGWSVTLLGRSPQLLHSTGIHFGRGIPLTNGGIRVRMVNGRVSGS